MAQKITINDVEIEECEQIPDGRGTVRQFITGDYISHFGECYTTTIYKGIIKGFHGYYTKTINYCVPVGLVKLVLWDNRINSATKDNIMELYLGVENYLRVSIPPGVMNAFQGIAEVSLAVVVASERFDERRTIRMPFNDPSIPYDWNK